MRRYRRFATLNTFRNRLALFVGGLSLVIGVLVATFAGLAGGVQLTDASGNYLRQAAHAASSAIEKELQEREREIMLLSRHSLLVASDSPQDDVRALLDLIASSYPYYSWLGFTDKTGGVRVARNGLLEGKNVSHRDWFRQAINGPFVGDVHQAVLLEKLLPRSASDAPLRFIDVASPITDNSGNVSGVIAAHLNFAWVSATLNNALPSSQHNDIEAFIVNNDGEVLYPFDRIGKPAITLGVLSQENTQVVSWGHAKYLTSVSSIRPDISTPLGWKIIVRQPVASALSGLTVLLIQIAIATVLVGLVFVFFAYRLATRFSKPIESLARQAESVTDEKYHSFSVPSGLEEVASLARALQSMMNKLAIRRQHLQEANALLEERVELRTRELEQANRKLEKQALQDPLTGLKNRRALNEYLHQAYLRFKRGQKAYSVAVIDIDHFKKVNDTFGHEAGDNALRHLAELLTGSARESDFICRSGGEEFVLIMPETDKAGAQVVAEKVRKKVAATPHQDVGRMTISIGVATISQQDDKASETIARADEALYKAKHNGRNRTEVSE
ncbi:sensor domain-containing diguanylate cyclase [Alteromonas sp. CYL-A6]|uniref:sensor domain-containing diguanylate cyclase n=1 Tax=Alteromonas nitratireducens TaxID=3390813 RepID=UPI0034B8CCC4